MILSLQVSRDMKSIAAGPLRGGPDLWACLTWWTFRIFFIFLLLGEGEGGVRAPGGGVRFLIENPQEGDLQEREGLRGREGVCSELATWGGGGLIFFSGPKFPPS